MSQAAEKACALRLGGPGFEIRSPHCLGLVTLSERKEGSWFSVNSVFVVKVQGGCVCVCVKMPPTQG